MAKGVYRRTEEYRKYLRERIILLQKTRKYFPRTKEEKFAISIGTRKALKGKSAWNKGLSKKTSESVRKNAEKRKGRKTTPETKKKISNSVKANPPRYWLGKHRSEETKQKLRISRSKQKLPIKNTIPEQIIEKELKKRKINYISQYSMLNGKTIADFYLPESKIVIYADGDYWHNLPNYIERDVRVTKELQDSGYTVFRFWEKDIKKNISLLLYSALK